MFDQITWVEQATCDLDDTGKEIVFQSIKQTLNAMKAPETTPPAPLLGDMIPNVCMAILNHLFGTRKAAPALSRAPTPSRESTHHHYPSQPSSSSNPPAMPATSTRATVDLSKIKFPDGSTALGKCHHCLIHVHSINPYGSNAQSQINRKRWPANEMTDLKHDQASCVNKKHR